MIFTGLSTSQHCQRHSLLSVSFPPQIGALLCLLMILLSPTLNAAEIVAPGVERSLIGSPLSPAFGLPQIPAYDEEEEIEPVLPPVQPLGDPQRLFNNPSFHLSRINITGNNSVDPAKIRQLTRPYEDRTIFLSELHQLRHEISNFYLKSGYINSGALIPDQQIIDGAVDIRIIEGGLTAIQLQGNSALSEHYIASRIELDTAPPLNLVKLGNRLQLLQQHPVIKSLKTELKPGLKPGESTLNVLVDEKKPYQFQFALSNDHSPSVGSYTLDSQWVNHSLTGHGDSLNLSASWSKGLKGYGISYSLPISTRDTQLNMSYNKDSTVVVEAPFQDLDIEGDSWTAALSLMHPFIKTSHSNLSATLGISIQSSSTTLLGEAFDFSNGSENGKSKSSAIRFSQDWINRSSDQVIALRSTIIKGIDLFDSTIHQ